MTNSNDNIEQVFKKGLNNLELDVSSKVWDNIDSELFGTQLAIENTESWTKIFSISLLPMALLFLATFLVDDEPKHNTDNIIITTKIEQSNEDNNLEESKVVEKIVYDYETLKGEVEIIKDKESSVKEEIVIEQKSTTPVLRNKDTNAKKEIKKDKTPILRETPYLNNDYYKGKSKKIYSKYSINKLKKGVLLVRLKTNKNSINAMKRRGMVKKAKKAQRQINNENKAIINAFKDKYNFSEVYFFYSYNTNNVKNMKFKNVFLNEELEEDNSIKLDPLYTFYMIGDFDKVRTKDHDSKYDGTSSLISRALVIKDRDFEQMARPFPFFIKAGSKGMVNNHVYNLNKQLNWYYRSNRK